MTPLFSLSEAERVEACTASAVLPRTSRPVGEPGRRGQALHELVRNIARVGLEAALDLAPLDMRDDLAHYPTEGLPSSESEHAFEVAFALDLLTGKARLLGQDIGREYAKHGATGADIVGTADYLTLLGSDRVGVDDLKTGRRAVTRARDNLQVTGLAAMAAKVYERSGARVRLLVRREDGSGYFDGADLDAFDLDAAAERLLRIGHRVNNAGNPPHVNEGPHCDYCPCFDFCPAKTTLLRALVRAEDGMIVEHTREAYETLHRIGVAYERAKARLKDYVKERGPIDLGDGTVYGWREVPRPVIDPMVARRELAGFGQIVADAACKMETSKAAIRRALKLVAPPRKLHGMHLAVLQRITEAGGVKIDRRPRCEVYRPGAVEIEEE